MENYLYSCHHCGKDYKPNRRIVQKYCSNSCRTRAFVLKKELGIKDTKKSITQKTKENKKEQIKIDSMSLAGVGNAALGTLAVNTITNLFISEENKPATKKDLSEVKSLLTRYQLVKNLSFDQFGNAPFFDIETKSIVYLKK
jgi:hypothetical protein